MTTRRATIDDLPAILALYRVLQPDDPVLSPRDTLVQQHWAQIMQDTRFRYFVGEADGAIVTTCTLSIIPNLTRNMRPYGLIENVVTAPEHRKKGHATSVLRAALKDAWAENCYKVMLLTGSKKEETLRFYENAGFLRNIKTGFIAYPKENTV